LTADSPDWNPHHARLFDDNKKVITNEDVHLKQSSRRRTATKAKTDQDSKLDAEEQSKLLSPVPRALLDIQNTLNDGLFLSAIRSTVEATCKDLFSQKSNPKIKTRTEPTTGISSTKTKTTFKLTPEILAQKWNIGSEAAKRTLRVTAQRGIKTVTDPSAGRRRGERLINETQPFEIRSAHHNINSWQQR
jgi:hypothetical protein